MDKIAVVILNWNGKAMLEKFLPSVIKYSTEAKVIVADNGSTDDSLVFLKENFPEVEVLLLAKNYGFAQGYNNALQKVEAEYYLLLNSDVEVTPHWLSPLLSYMDKHEEVAVCQPKLLSERNHEVFEYAGAAGGFIDKYGYPFCRGRIFDKVEVDYGQYDTIQSLFWATGAALLVRSKDWREVGGFDGRFFAHMEEIDFCWRVRSRGKKIVCIPESKVFHVGGGTLNAGNPRKTYLNFRNNLMMLYKNVPDKNLKSIMRVRRVLDYIAAFKMLCTDGVGHFKAVVEARKDFYRLKKKLNKDRKSNLEHTIISDYSEQLSTSLLWLYYVRGCKVFTQLPQNFIQKNKGKKNGNR